MSYRIVSVPDALMEDDTISFRIIISEQILGQLLASDHTENDKQPVQFTKDPILRNFNHISWLHSSIAKNYPHQLVPGLPEIPSPEHLSETDYISRKRLQIERFLNRLLFRKDILSDPFVKIFLGTGPMDPKHSELSSSSSLFRSLGLNFGVLDHIIKSNNDRGFHLFRPAINVPENNEKDFTSIQAQVLQMEDHYHKILDSIQNSFGSMQGLAESMEQIIILFQESKKPNFMLGTGEYLDNSRKLARFGACIDQLVKTFDDSHTALRKRVKFESSFCADVISEHLQMLQSIKNVMNHRTNMLASYVSSIKDETGRRSKMEQSKTGTAISKALSTADHTSSLNKLEDCRTLFKEAQTSVSREFIRFERLKLIDFREALFRFAQIQVETYKTELQSHESALQSIRTYKKRPKDKVKMPESSSNPQNTQHE